MQEQDSTTQAEVYETDAGTYRITGRPRIYPTRSAANFALDAGEQRERLAQLCIPWAAGGMVSSATATRIRRTAGRLGGMLGIPTAVIIATAIEDAGNLLDEDEALR